MTDWRVSAPSWGDAPEAYDGWEDAPTRRRMRVERSPWRACSSYAEPAVRLEIAKLRHVPGEPGWGVRFASTPDPAVFEAGKALIKALPIAHRRWDAAARLWWVSKAAFPLLRDAVPALDALLTEKGIPATDAPEGYVCYQHHDIEEAPTYQMLHRLSCGSAHTAQREGEWAANWSAIYTTLTQAAQAAHAAYDWDDEDTEIDWRAARLCKHCLPGLPHL